MNKIPTQITYKTETNTVLSNTDYNVWVSVWSRLGKYLADEIAMVINSQIQEIIISNQIVLTPHPCPSQKG